MTSSQGNSIAMNIVRTFQPKYWEKEDYKNKHYITSEVDYDSNEFQEISGDIYKAQDCFTSINNIRRIQNPYTYSRFMLRKKFMKLLNGNVYQKRRFKVINKNHIELALQFNCDGRRFGQKCTDSEFFDKLPYISKNLVILVLQVLTSDDSQLNAESIVCENDSEFYIEYVVFCA